MTVIYKDLLQTFKTMRTVCSTVTHYGGTYTNDSLLQEDSWYIYIHSFL